MLKVKVMKKHIANGECGEPEFCAIALAILDSDKKITKVRVGYNELNIEYGKENLTYQMTKKSKRFVSKFDDNKKSVKPDTFIFKLMTF